MSINSADCRPLTCWIVFITLRKHTDGVVKGHGFDVERRQNRLLVGQRRVVVARNFCRQYHTHVAQIHVDRSQVGPT